MEILTPYKKSITTKATSKLFFEEFWAHPPAKTIILYQGKKFLITF